MYEAAAHYEISSQLPSRPTLQDQWAIQRWDSSEIENVIWIPKPLLSLQFPLRLRGPNY